MGGWYVIRLIAGRAFLITLHERQTVEASTLLAKDPELLMVICGGGLLVAVGLVSDGPRAASRPTNPR